MANERDCIGLRRARSDHAMLSWSQARAIALAQPQADQGEHCGKPAFRVGKKTFMQLSAEGVAPACAQVKLAAADQAALLLTHGEAFSLPPHGGRYGWTRVFLDAVDAAVFEDLVRSSWHVVAPKRRTTASHRR